MRGPHPEYDEEIRKLKAAQDETMKMIDGLLDHVYNLQRSIVRAKLDQP